MYVDEVVRRQWLAGGIVRRYVSIAADSAVINVLDNWHFELLLRYYHGGGSYGV